KPGLVGGHCIGVDPYYLAQKAQEHGYHPEIILAGRRLNDSMGEYVASQVIKTMIKKGVNVAEAEVLMLGITFKENCPDVRNTKIVDVIHALEDYGVKVSIYDPWANPAEVKHEYGIDCCADLSEAKVNGTKNTENQKHKKTKKYDAVVLGVAHKEFLDLDLKQYLKEGGVVYDVKGVLGDGVDAKL